LRLILLRHGKSDWDAPYGHDHDRPLAPRGRKAARAVGRFLTVVGRAPDAILSSTAKRAFSTVELAAEAGSWRAKIDATPDLYGSDAERVLEAARVYASDKSLGAGTLLLAGHEPTWSELAGRLVGGHSAARLAFPTATIASILFFTQDWQNIDFGLGELELLIKPKLLQRLNLEGK
jgi:phosphohistidine phosphatase